VLHLLLGSPDKAMDDGRTVEARRAFDRRDNTEAMRLWPRTGGLERRVLARLMKTHRPSAAIHAIDEKIRRIWVAAVQSRLFNEVLALRINTLDQLMDGDLAYKHDNGACFRVESAATEQARCEAFEISPTGPLVGYRMTMPEGQPLAVEQAAMAAVNLTPEAFRQSGKLRVKGARRPLRVRPTDVELAGGVDEFGPHVTVAFTLPAGAFATVLMRELMKADAEDDVPDEAADGFEAGGATLEAAGDATT
jgi:tRNA pseudouridine13 synthase